MDPFLLPRVTIAWIRFWFRVWSRLIGKKAILGLTALSTLVMVIVVACDSQAHL